MRGTILDKEFTRNNIQKKTKDIKIRMNKKSKIINEISYVNIYF